MTNKKESIITLVCGIISLAGAAGIGTSGITGVVGLVCAIVALVFSKKGLAAGPDNKMLKVGKILAIIGIVLSIIGIVWGIICACTVGAISSMSN